MLRYALSCLLLLFAQPGWAGESTIPDARLAFSIATAPYLAINGVPAQLIRYHRSTVRVVFQELPATRWDASWGSYPKFVAETLRTLGDSNARYEGSGAFKVSQGPRNILLDTLTRFRDELSKRGLDLRLITLDRDMVKNGAVGGDVNSDHMIGLAADGAVTVAMCAKSARDCGLIANSPLEQQLRIIEAAVAAGVQQLNMYGELHGVAGQSLHIGVSPFRNGAKGELLRGIPVGGIRRIEYGSSQKWMVAALSATASQYIGIGGTGMQSVFNRLLHNPPPPGYEAMYEALRDRDLAKIRSIVNGRTE